MRLGVVCPNVPGHLNPLSTLAGELARRGHTVTLLGDGRTEGFAARESLGHASIGGDDPLVAELDIAWRKLAESSPTMSMVRTGQIFGKAIEIQLKHLPRVLAEHDFDALVVDQLSPAAAVVADRVGLPYVVACCALAMYPDPLAPPPPLPWGYRDDLLGRLRNWASRTFIPPLYYWLSDQRKNGVNPLLLLYELDRGEAKIAQQPAFFDFPRTTTPDDFHYTAPWSRASRDDGSIDFPWDRLDDRPLVYASMGTLQNRLGYVFEAILEAVEGLDMQVVLTQGGGEVDLPASIPDNVIVVPRAPQLRLLERASLAITHAGLNTALECLTKGVPMLCLPVTNDQPGVAKRVEWLGAGRVLPVGRVTTERLKRELAAMTATDKYTRVAQECRDKLANENGLATAADIVESSLSAAAAPELAKSAG